MSLVSYQSWPESRRFQSGLHRLFDDAGFHIRSNATSDSDRAWSPLVDIREEDQRYVLQADIPGVDPKDIEVTMNGKTLTISGKREHSVTKEQAGLQYAERARGSFHRRVNLPRTVASEGITANCANGVLEVVIPKQPQESSQRIQVN